MAFFQEAAQGILTYANKCINKDAPEPLHYDIVFCTQYCLTSLNQRQEHQHGHSTSAHVP